MGLNGSGLGFVITAQNLASEVFNKVGNDFDKLATKPEKMTEAMRGASGQMKATGAALIGFGSAGVAGLGLAVKEAAHFGQGIIETGTLVDHASFPVEKMTEMTKQMALQFGGDVNDQVKALYQGISAGATDAAKAQGLLLGANQLAVAGHTDQTTAILGLTKVLNNYKMDFADAGVVSDAFFAAIKGGATTAGELGSSVGEVAATAQNAGISMQELIAAMGTGATLMKDTAQATTSMKAALANLAHPAAEATAEAAKLGISFTSTHLRAVGFAQFLKEITTSAKYSANSMNNLFGSVEGASIMTALASNNMSAFNDTLAGVNNSAGMTAAAFEEMSGGLEKQGDILHANIQVAAIELGQQLVPVVKMVTNVVKAVVQAFVALPGPVKQVIAFALAAASVFSIVAGAAVLVGGAVMGLATVGEAAAIAFGVMSQILLVVAAGFAVVGLAAAGFQEAMAKNVGGVMTWFTNMKETVSFVFDALGTLFRTGKLTGGLVTQWDAASVSTQNFITTLFLWGNRIFAFFDGIKSGFGGAVAGMGPVFSTLTGAFDALLKALGFVKDAPDEARAKFMSFGSAGQDLGKILGKAFELIVQGVTMGINVVRGFAQGLDTMKPVLDVVSNAFGVLWQGLMSLGSIFDDTNTGLSTSQSSFDMLGKTMAYVATAVAAVFGALAYVVGGAINIVGSLLGGLVTMFGGLWDMASGGWNVLAGILTGDWPRVWKGAGQYVLGIVKVVVGALAAMVSAVAGAVDTVGKLFGKDLGIKNAVEGGKNDLLKDVASGLGQDDSPGGDPTKKSQKGAINSWGGEGGVHPALQSMGVDPAGAKGVAPAALGAPPQPPPPQVVHLTSQLVIDGEVLATAVQKSQTNAAARNFGMTNPPP